MIDVAIIDNGGANIASLRYALERLGASSFLTADPGELRDARRVILPGVGAAADAMARLRTLGLVDLLPQLTQPVLGICLGMQLLFASSEEGEDGEDTECLGLIDERVTRFPERAGFPVPHMGWNQLRLVAPSPLFAGIDFSDAYLERQLAAAEGEADARPLGLGLLRRVSRDLGRRRRRPAGRQQERHDPRRARAAAQEFDHSQLFRIQSTAERVQSRP
jgi:glutamine amidotransferase